MCRRLLVRVVALTCLTGLSLVSCAPVPVSVSVSVSTFVGSDVLLPCSFKPSDTDELTAVEWSKEGLEPDVVFLFRDGCENLEMKNVAFQHRTSLLPKEMKNGNVSLRISNVQPSDAGKYRCMRLWKKAEKQVTALMLHVGPVAEPKLSRVSGEAGGVTLQCEASCWLLQPEVDFVDEQGNELPADEPRQHDEASSGCKSLTRRVTVQKPTKSVTCRVHHLQINQTRSKDLLLEYVEATSNTACITVGTIGGIFVICGLIFFLKKRCRKPAKGGKSPAERQTSNNNTMTVDQDSSLQSVEADNEGNSIIEKKLEEIPEPELRLQDNKPQLNRVYQPEPPLTPTFTNLPNSDDQVQNQQPGPGLSRQNSYPVPDCRNQNIHLNSSSSPDLRSSTWAGPSSAGGPCSKLNCTRSESCARPGVPKHQRRRSLVLPPSPGSSKPFSFMTDLSEEEEQLLS